MRAALGGGAAGVALGLALSGIGFSSYDEVQAMFTFRDLRLTLAFATGALLLLAAWPIAKRFGGARWPSRPIRRGTLLGGVLFGLGWALAGACPGVAFVQIGEGQLGALVTLAGIFAGNWLYAVMHDRYFRWKAPACDSP